MKNIYDVLNDTKVRTEDYEPMELNDLEKAGMKQSIRRAANAKKKSAARWAAVAVCMVCVIGFSQTAYAKEALNNILQSVSIGHSTIMQVDPMEKNKQYYDKDGKPITEIKNHTDLYDAKGKYITTVNVSSESTDDGYIIEKDLNKTISQLSFKLLTPKTIPTGYNFDHSKLYKDENGKASRDCIALFYMNGTSKILIQERQITLDNAFKVGTDGSFEKVTINGHSAVLLNGSLLIWEQNGVSVSIHSKTLSRDELLKFAESFK